MARGMQRLWYQPNKYYERPIRIQLRSLGTLRRKRPWRPGDFSLYDLFSQRGLIYLEFAEIPLKISALGVETDVACHTKATSPFVRADLIRGSSPARVYR